MRGWLKIHSYTDPPENLLQHRVWTLCDAGGQQTRYAVAEDEFDGRWVRARLEGIEDRDAAELLRGSEIEVARSALPPTAAREYYRADLIGLAVRNRDGVPLGEVKYFIEAPAAPVMVVAGVRELWIPAVPRHLLKVDLAAGQIEVDWPEQL